MSVSGTLASFSFDKVKYRVANDVDISRKTSKFTKEAQATSGDPNFVFETQVETAEGFVLVLDGAQREVLKAALDSIEPKACSYTDRKGNNYTATCHLNSTDDTTREAKVTVDAMPITADGWTPTIV
jgi:hypothetical protein